MKINKNLIQASVASAALLSGSLTYAEKLDVNFGGFIRGEVGSGDRYGKAQGEDTLGVSKAALTASSSFENVDFSLLIGGRKMAHTAGADDGEIDLEEAYVTINNVRDTPFTLSVGIQPLMLGLKPNGYPGDRSIQGSIEYGIPAGGVPQMFAYSNQVEPSLIAVYDFSENVNFSFGIFDTNTSNNTGTDGSSFFDNLFIQVRADELFLPNVYAAAGIEKRYVSATDSSETAFDIGFGYRADMFDISYEYISLNNGYVGTVDDETISVLELTLNIFENASLYLDYATASEMDVDTIRFGAIFDISTAFNFQIEYASDDMPTTDAESIDLRVEYSF